MLSAQHRLTDSELFARTVRFGQRSGGPMAVAYLLRAGDMPTTQVGFVVSKAVGNAVTRNTVKRRLRVIARGYLSQVPSGSILVLRALPPSATATFSELQEATDRLLERLAKKVAA